MLVVELVAGEALRHAQKAGLARVREHFFGTIVERVQDHQLVAGIGALDADDERLAVGCRHHAGDALVAESEPLRALPLAVGVERRFGAIGLEEQSPVGRHRRQELVAAEAELARVAGAERQLPHVRGLAVERVDDDGVAIGEAAQLDELVPAEVVHLDRRGGVEGAHEQVIVRGGRVVARVGDAAPVAREQRADRPARVGRDQLARRAIALTHHHARGVGADRSHRLDGEERVALDRAFGLDAERFEAPIVEAVAEQLIVLVGDVEPAAVARPVDEPVAGWAGDDVAAGDDGPDHHAPLVVAPRLEGDQLAVGRRQRALGARVVFGGQVGDLGPPAIAHVRAPCGEPADGHGGEQRHDGDGGDDARRLRRRADEQIAHGRRVARAAIARLGHQLARQPRQPRRHLGAPLARARAARLVRWRAIAARRVAAGKGTSPVSMR